MADRELRRMSRADLIEIIYELRKSEEALQKENESLKRQLKTRQEKISKAGSLAELSANLNDLFESAQATADQYLKEIKAARKQARAIKAEAAKLAKLTLKQRKELLARTEAECQKMLENAAAGRATPRVPQKEQRRVNGSSALEEPKE